MATCSEMLTFGGLTFDAQTRDAQRQIDVAHPERYWFARAGVNLREQFGDIDIYLFDQLLRGRISSGAESLTRAAVPAATWFGYFGRRVLTKCSPLTPAVASGVVLPQLLRRASRRRNFRVSAVEDISFPDAFVDVVVSSAVLHFASDDQHLLAMLRGSWRVLKPGGLFFCHLASTIGIEHQWFSLSCGSPGR